MDKCHKSRLNAKVSKTRGKEAASDKTRALPSESPGGTKAEASAQKGTQKSPACHRCGELGRFIAKCPQRARQTYHAERPKSKFTVSAAPTPAETVAQEPASRTRSHTAQHGADEKLPETGLFVSTNPKLRRMQA